MFTLVSLRTQNLLATKNLSVSIPNSEGKMQLQCCCSQDVQWNGIMWGLRNMLSQTGFGKHITFRILFRMYVRFALLS